MSKESSNLYLRAFEKTLHLNSNLVVFPATKRKKKEKLNHQVAVYNSGITTFQPGDNDDSHVYTYIEDTLVYSHLLKKGTEMGTYGDVDTYQPFTGQTDSQMPDGDDNMEAPRPSRLSSQWGRPLPDRPLLHPAPGGQQDSAVSAPTWKEKLFETRAAGVVRGRELSWQIGFSILTSIFWIWWFLSSGICETIWFLLQETLLPSREQKTILLKLTVTAFYHTWRCFKFASFLTAWNAFSRYNIIFCTYLGTSGFSLYLNMCVLPHV